MKKNRYFASHSKSSAMVVSLAIHAVLIVVAISFVAVKVIVKEEPAFEAKRVKRPKMPPKKIQVPVDVKKKPKPRLRKRIVSTANTFADIKMPEITGVKGGLGNMGGTGGGSLGFTMPEIDFFGVKSKGGNVVFIVHFGPATSGATPYERMTSYTIRKRLEEMIEELPGDTLFNVTAYWVKQCTPFSDKLLLATPENKQQLLDWMEPVNPVKGQTKTYGEGFNPAFNKRLARLKWPNRLVKKVPPFGPKWYYSYKVPKEINDKYLPGSKQGFVHWSRALTWALQTQNPGTIFILTTNYISDKPEIMVGAYEKMCRDLYGPNREDYPSVNVVVLSHAGNDSQIAWDVLKDRFYPIYSFFRGEGSVIKDIKDFMTEEELERLKTYKEATSAK
jgi:hypothetical protein